MLRREASAAVAWTRRVCPRTGQFWRPGVGSTSSIWSEGLIGVGCNEKAPSLHLDAVRWGLMAELHGPAPPHGPLRFH